ncbi:MAG TPA: hypothetical protein VLR88_03420 [Propionibacteriaceae bacterium]|nr:hypothetical protein [Propionibacteriaceae bacterium]
MNIDDGGLTPFEHDDLRDLVLAGASSIRPAGSPRVRLVAAGLALLLLGALVGGVVAWVLRPAPPLPAVVTGVPSSRTTVWSGWVAFSAGPGDGAIYLVKEGSPPRRILGSDGDGVDQACPAFSPDGARLASGQVIDDGSSGRNAALVITELSADGEPSDTTTLALDGLAELPCPVWSADGRWLAFGADADGAGVSGVWVVDTRTNDIRRLTGLWATDLEWAPGASELFIASNGISIYSTATDTTDFLDGTLGAVALAVSPDGKSLAVQRSLNTTVAGRMDLVLMGAHGSDQRLLVSGYKVGFGIGPVWSPDGNRVAFQRLCDTYMADSGRDQTCLEEHEVVVVAVTDHDPRGPSGTQTVIPAPQTTIGGQTRQWFPYSATWSPDSRTLLYVAWSALGSGILAVPVDSATPPVVLEDALDVAGHRSNLWNTFQSWSKQP